MLEQKTKRTSRKFYNKWLYKVSLRIEGCAVLRTHSVGSIKQFFADNDGIKYVNNANGWNKSYINKKDIISLCDFLVGFSTDTYAIRIENPGLDVYTNNPEFYQLLSLHCEEHVVHRFQPDAASLDILNSPKNLIAVTKLPKGRYHHRVYLLPHKMSKDRLGKQKYLDWIKAQSPRITCTRSLETWFLNTDWNWDRRYVLVEDEATVLMMKLRNADVVGTVYKFVVCDK